MNAIPYTVGAIPIAIARQIMVKLTAAQILAKLTPYRRPDESTQLATIEVALFDRIALDDLLIPFEAQLRSAHTLSADLPFPVLHASVMDGHYALGSGSADHDAFTGLLISYQTVAADSARLFDLADVCARRIARANLPLDLIAAYGSLGQLARWRAEQLRGGQ
jgi:hypothetical protein